MSGAAAADDESSAGRWVVLGASGFVGAAVVRAVRDAGPVVIEVPAPRLTAPVSAGPAELVTTAGALLASGAVDDLVRRLDGVAVVVVAAGLAVPGAPPSPALTGANGLLPVVVALAAGRAGVDRVVHVSSAAVQGDREQLDDSEAVDPQTPYATSKALGETALALLRPRLRTTLVIARATSVQGPGRATTQSLTRFARSPVSSVAGAGEDPVPVTSPEGLGRWVLDLGLRPDPPRVSLQPWEGWTTAALLRDLGGREPLHLPVRLARGLVRAGYLASRVAGGRGRAAVRRVELVWFGQRQAHARPTSTA